jgi:uncharacterized protein (TIGR02271 family)
MPTIEEVRAWRGGTVVDRAGDKVGSIDEVYMDQETGEPEWLAVKTGLFGTRLSFVPLAEASRSGDEVRVPYEKAEVKDAPSVDPDGELSQQGEASLYAHYRLAYGESRSDSGLPQGHDTSGPTTHDAMTRSEEELAVGTREREAGRLRLRKWVETEPVQTTVEVRREKVRLEREPITGENVGDAMDGPAISEEEHELTLHAEEPVVEKRVVPKERVRATTETVTDEAEIREQVRKERIDADGDAEPRR